MSSFKRSMSITPPSIAQPPRRRGWLRRVVTVGVTAMMVGSVGAVAFSTPATAATVDTNTWYELVNRNSGKALDVCGESTADGACVQQWTRWGGQNQQWQFVDSGGGYYRLRARHSGKVLDVYEWSTANGAPIVQRSDHNGNNQQWRLEDSPGGYVRLISRHSGKALEAPYGNTDDGAPIVQYEDWGGTNQQWQLIPVDGGSPPTQPPGTCALP